MQNKDIQILGYYFEQSPINGSTFKCKLELKFKEEEVLEFYGNGKNKKTAKQEAAKMAFLHLQDFAVSKVDNQLEAIRKLIEEGLLSNAISLICQYFETRMPIYAFKEISSVPEPEFECTAEIVIKDFTASVTQTGNSKKAAKNKVVSVLIEEIRTYFKDF
jgi:dsRNA-specific ribonuclease